MENKIFNINLIGAPEGKIFKTIMTKIVLHKSQKVSDL